MNDQKRKSIDELSDASEEFEVAFDRLIDGEADDLSRTTLVTEITKWLQLSAAHGRYFEPGSAERRSLRHMLDSWRSKLRTLSVDVEGIETIAEFDSQAGIPLVAQCPYPGLDPYTQSESGDFFGRETVAASCVDHLDRPSSRILLIIGPSGSGKSSVAMAGILPSLQAKHRDAWLFVPRFTPGSAPMRELASAVAGALGGPAFADELFRDLMASPTAAQQCVAKATNNRPIMLLIDQFEELMTLGRDATERIAFAKALEALAKPGTDEHSFSCHLLLTLRTDHLARFEKIDELRGLYALLVSPENQRYLSPIGADSIKRAIQGPADNVGLRFVPPKLVDQLATETAGLANGLPLLQYALRRLWETRPTNRDGKPLDLITADMVHRLPDVKGALGTVAEGIFQTFSTAQRTVCERLLLELVVLDETFEEPLRRRRMESELVQLLRDRGFVLADVSTVIDRFVGAELLRRFGDLPNSQIEVAHEALLRHWVRISDLLDGPDIKTRLHWVKRIRVEAAQWAGRGQRSDDLTLKGENLTRAVAFAADGWLSEAQVAAYVDACSKEEQRQNAKDEELRSEKRRADHERELAAHERLARAEEQARHATARSRWGWSAVVVAAVAVLASVLLGWSADRQHRQSAIQSMQLAEEQTDPHAQLALLSDALRHDPDAWTVASRMIGNIRQRAQLFTQNFQHQGAVYTAAFSPDNKYVVTASEDHTAVIWNVADGVQAATLQHQDAVTHAEFSDDNRHVVTASRDGSARLWAWNGSAIEGPPTEIVAPGPAPMNNVRFSRGGQLVVTASDLYARVWDLGGKMVSVGKRGSAVVDAEFSHDGRKVLIREARGNVATILDVGNSDQQELTHGQQSEIPLTLARFAPSAGLALTAGADGSVLVWDTRHLSAPNYQPVALNISGPPAATLAADFSGDGHWLVTADAVGRALVWDVQDGLAPRGSVGGSDASAQRVSTVQFFTREGETKLIAALDDGTSKIYEMDAMAPGVFKPSVAPLFHRDAVRTASFSHDGTKAVSASIDGTARLWDVGSGSAKPSGQGDSHRSPTGEPIQLSGGVRSATVSPDGTLMALARAEGLWLATEQGGAWADPVELTANPVTAVEFSRDSRWLIAILTDPTPEFNAQVFGDLRPLAQRPPSRQLSADVGSDQVISAAVAPEGRWATGSLAGAITVGQFGATTKPAKCRHAGPVSSLEFSNDGRRLLSASYDFNVTLWDVGSGGRCTAIRSFAHPGVVYSAAFNPDDTWVLTASQGGARVWDADSGVVVHVLDEHNPIDDAVFNTDGSLAATASTREAQLWDVRTGRRLGAPLPGEALPADLTRFGRPPLARVRFSSDTWRIWIALQPRVESGDTLRDPRLREFTVSVGDSTPRRGLPFLMRSVGWTVWPNNDWGEVSELLEAVAGLKLVEQRLQPLSDLPEVRKRFSDRAKDGSSRIGGLAAFLMPSSGTEARDAKTSP